MVLLLYLLFGIVYSQQQQNGQMPQGLFSTNGFPGGSGSQEFSSQSSQPAFPYSYPSKPSELPPGAGSGRIPDQLQYDLFGGPPIALGNANAFSSGNGNAFSSGQQNSNSPFSYSDTYSNTQVQLPSGNSPPPPPGFGPTYGQLPSPPQLNPTITDPEVFAKNYVNSQNSPQSNSFSSFPSQSQPNQQQYQPQQPYQQQYQGFQQQQQQQQQPQQPQLQQILQQQIQTQQTQPFQPPKQQQQQKSKSSLFTLHSSEFEDGGCIPIKYGCTTTDHDWLKESISLTWDNPPKITASFVLLIDDVTPNVSWIHWLASDIPPEVRGFTEGTSRSPDLPLKEHLNSWGVHGFGGFCPPSKDRTHAYRFRLFARTSPVTEFPDQNLSNRERNLQITKILENSIGVAELTGRYSLTGECGAVTPETFDIPKLPSLSDDYVSSSSSSSSATTISQSTIQSVPSTNLPLSNLPIPADQIIQSSSNPLTPQISQSSGNQSFENNNINNNTPNTAIAALRQFLLHNKSPETNSPNAGPLSTSLFPSQDTKPNIPSSASSNPLMAALSSAFQQQQQQQQQTPTQQSSSPQQQQQFNLNNLFQSPPSTSTTSSNAPNPFLAAFNSLQSQQTGQQTGLGLGLGLGLGGSSSPTTAWNGDNSAQQQQQQLSGLERLNLLKGDNQDSSQQQQPQQQQQETDESHSHSSSHHRSHHGGHKHHRPHTSDSSDTVEYH